MDGAELAPVSEREIRVGRGRLATTKFGDQINITCHGFSAFSRLLKRPSYILTVHCLDGNCGIRWPLNVRCPVHEKSLTKHQHLATSAVFCQKLDYSKSPIPCDEMRLGTLHFDL